MATPARKPVMLSCWKDIAVFFGKGVRTVQRWESSGLPVHRPTGNHNIVFAEPDELVRWALERKKRRRPALERCMQLLEETQTTAENTRRLVAESQALIAKLKEISPDV